MTPKQQALKAHLIKVIHTLRGQCGLGDEEVYRGVLQNAYGVRSSKDMELGDLIDFAKKLGCVPPKKDKEKAISKNATQKQLDTIVGLWEQVARDKSPLALRNFCDKIIKKRPLYLSSLGVKEAQKVILALLEMKKRASVD